MVELRLLFIGLLILFFANGCQRDDLVVVIPADAVVGDTRSNSSERFIDQFVISSQGSIAEIVSREPSARPDDSDLTLPKLISYPNKLSSNSGKREKLYYLFQVDEGIDTVYMSIEGEGVYKMFSPESSPVFLSNTNNEPIVYQSVEIDIVIPDDIPSDEYCFNLSGGYKGNRISKPRKTCININLQEDSFSSPSGVYFGDFSSNSSIAVFDSDMASTRTLVTTDYEITDIAFLDDTLYAITFSDLIEFDLDNSRTYPPIYTGFMSMNALVGFNGSLFVSSNGDFAKLNPKTGVRQVISLLPDGFSTSGDLAVNDNEEIIWATVKSPVLENDYLMEIEPNTGKSQIVGNIGFTNVWGLEYYRNQLIGFTQAGEQLIIDPSTGLGIKVNDLNIVNISGIAIRK